ncbi:TolC family protein [Campylobacter helveticus]|uniref:TolC family protein n=1 Tax=Campylobacter helveticus TaxID=28898 RepID=A0AAX2UGE7_9BACT|nr:TolC family protein [Campylobacter helveticus]ARE80866.1 multidrug efflux system CmeDEF, outer membrane component CmeD [Campylobacter helveticus]MCR2054879.1 TolC family protein [Campylobacter helveticus]TNB55535.1 TolC family protein [Campylobacter helveticus]TNB55932.1 TolC family protein [Campylobacter helveticus]TNB59588.1 TolC family protein [Campylobacter helveticus]
MKKINKCLVLILTPLILKASNLNELIELSLKNESYLIKELQNLQSIAQKDAAFNAYLPSLSLNSGYMANNKDRSLIDPNESLFSRLSLNFLLYDGGKREAHIKSLKLKEILTRLDKKEQKNLLALSATTLYFNYLSLEEIVKANEQKKAFLKQNLIRLENFHKAGLSAKDELESIRAKYHLASLELSQNLLKIENLKKELFVLATKEFTPLGKASLKEPRKSQSQNIKVLKAKEQIYLANEGVSMARAEFFPKFFVQNHLSFYENNHNPKIPAPYQNLGAEMFNESGTTNQILLGLEWKIFDFGARNKELESKRLNVQIQKANYALLKRQNEEELKYLEKNLSVLKEQIKALKYSLNAANLAYESVDRKYNAGLCSYVEYLGALELKFKALSDLELAKNELEITKANYYFTAGLEINKEIE